MKETLKLYGEIGYEIVGNDIERTINYYENSGCTELDLRIISPGGSVYDGMIIVKAILQCNTRGKMIINTYNDYWCLSIAFLIYLAGKKRFMCTDSLAMIHNPWGGTPEGLEKIRETLVTNINEITGMEIKTIKDYMDAETWFFPEDMKSLNLCDGIFNNKNIIVANGLDKHFKIESFNPFNESDFLEVDALIKERKKEEYLNIYNSIINEEKIKNKNFKMDELNTVKSENENLKKEIENLKKDLEAIKTESENIKNKATEDKINILIENASKNKVIDMDKMKNSFVTIGKTSVETLEQILNSYPENKKVFTDIKNHVTPEAPSGRDTWDINDYINNDPKALQDIEKNNPELIKELNRRAIVKFENKFKN